MKLRERLFRWSAIGILTGTAAAKLFSATGSAPILDFPDPLIGFANRQVLVLVGAIELAVVGLLLSPVPLRVKHLILAWISGNFLAYRVAFYSLNIGKPCPCLGTLTERLGLPASLVDWILWVIVLYLLAGSVFLLIQRRWAPAAKPLAQQL